MTITTSVYIATSLDGFIAREDGSIDWLMQANNTVPAGEDCGYAEFMSSVDVLIMGSNTYEQVAGFDPWPYEGKRVVVLTSRELEFRQGPNIHLEKSSEAPQELLKRLAAEGCKHAYVQGGKVIKSFLSNGLIDRLTITTIPVVSGKGRPLFGSILNDVRFKLSHSKVYEFGFIQTTYVARTDAKHPLAVPSYINYCTNLKEFVKKQFAVFFINFLLALFFAMLLEKLGGKYSREFEILLMESLPFKSILVVLPIQLFVCGIVLALLAFPCVRRYCGFWFQKYVLHPFAEFGAGLCVVAVAIIWGVAIAALVFESPKVAIELFASSSMLIVMVFMVLAVPYITTPSALGANSTKSLLVWSLFLILGAVFILVFSYRFEEDDCVKCYQMPNSLPEGKATQVLGS